MGTAGEKRLPCYPGSELQLLLLLYSRRETEKKKKGEGNTGAKLLERKKAGGLVADDCGSAGVCWKLVKNMRYGMFIFRFILLRRFAEIVVQAMIAARQYPILAD